MFYPRAVDQRPVLVVPCYNEEDRLAPERFHEFTSEADARILFVDDGSTDGTRAILGAACTRWPQRMRVLSLPRNVGKGEAVRRGLNSALREGAPIVGYADADLSTPPSELYRLLTELRAAGVSVVLGSRVALLGYDIQRSAVRHYLGRVFATFASSLLGLAIYDTQCGAKFFRSSDSLHCALAEPFVSRWSFDVELLGRLVIGSPAVNGLRTDQFLEVPLRTWYDVAGSKLKLKDMAAVTLDLYRIASDLERRRTDAQRALSRSR